MSGSTVGTLSVANVDDATGWAFAETADPDNKFVVSGSNLNTNAALNFEAAQSHSVTIQATKAGQETITRTFTISVTNVFEQPDLDALSVPAEVSQGATVNITGATSGSTITGTMPTGWTLDGAARTIAIAADAPLGSQSWSLTETLADSSNSPRVSSGSSVVIDALAGTPDGALESVIEPPNTSARSMYSFSKIGTINDFGNTGFDTLYGNGAYSASIVRAASTAYPDRHFMYYSPDHGELDSGIWAKVCVSDPTVIANWRTVADAAVNTDWLADIAGAPTVEGPIFIGSQTAGDHRQCETPYVIKVGSSFMMTYQMQPVSQAQGGGNYSGAQASHRAVSANGLTGWTTNNITWLEAPTIALGDGHTGYAQTFRNDLGGGEYLFDGSQMVNPATGNPWTYLVTSLASGGTTSLGGIWGVEDPLTEYPTLIALVNKFGGRHAPTGVGSIGNLWTFALTEISVSSFRKTRQGVIGVATAKPRGAGADLPDTATYEILLDANMRPVDGLPILSVPRGSSGAADETNTSFPRVYTFGSKDYVIYDGVSSAPKTKRQLLASTSIRRNPENTWLAPPAVTIPTGLTDNSVNFVGLSSLPAGVATVTSGTTSTSFDANGLNISVTEDGEFALFIDTPVDPILADFMEVIVEGLHSNVSAPARHVWVGWATQKALVGAQTDMLALTTQAAQEWVYKSVLVDGLTPLAPSKSDYFRGFGWTAEAQWPKQVGARIWPKLNTGVAVGENRAETEFLDNQTAGDNNNYVFRLRREAALYPCVIIKGLAGNDRVERIRSIAVRWKTSDITLPTFTLASSSANTGQAWTSIIANHVPGTTYTATSDDGTTITVTGSTLSGAFTTAGTKTLTITPTRTGATNSGVPQVGATVTVATATTPIDPATLIATHGGFVFDPSASATVFEDDAGTDVAEVGDGIAVLKDAAGGVAALSQTDATRRPILNTDGSKRWASYDGVNDWMRYLDTLNRPFTRISAQRMNSWTNNERLLGGGSGNADDLRQSGVSPNIIAVVGASTTIGTIAPTLGVDFIVSEIHVTSATAGTSKVRLNAGAWQTNNSTNTTQPGGVTRAASNTGTSNGHLDDYGFCYIYTDTLTDEQIKGVEAWLAAKCRDTVAI